jgi:uncharacterized protein (TIGR03083 family)
MDGTTTPGLAELVGQLRRDGALLADAAERAGPEAAVPTCPGWAVRDVVCHTGSVHRWAAHVVSTAAPEAPDAVDLVERAGGWPDDDRLAAWLRAGCENLADALESAPDSLECWTFMAAPTPRMFWARRQAHETAIHRVDLESAVGTVTPFPAPFAADGVDEILSGFAPRSRRLRGEPPCVLSVSSLEPARRWQLRIGTDAVTLGPSPDGRGALEAGDDDGGRPDAGDDAAGDGVQCAVRGSASDLYLWLWNRRDSTSLAVTGEPDVLRRWREGLQVRWS